MKILFFLESLGAGGKERRLMELIRYLQKDNGFTIAVVLMNKDIHYTEINELNIPVYYLERKFLKKDPVIFLRFYKIVSDFSPDIIHVWGNMPAFYSIPTKILKRVPLLNSQITDAPDKPKFNSLYFRFNFFFSDLIISNSKAGLKSYGVDGHKGWVIYNGFDFGRLDDLEDIKKVKKSYNISDEKFVVGMVASYSNSKDHVTFIKSAKRVLENRKDVVFLCVGAGDHSKYSEMIEEPLKENFLFLSKVKEIESLENVFDIMVLTSYTEGISNSILEGMALGKPVVYAGGGGIEELIENNISGFLMKSGEDEKVSLKIMELLENEELRIKTGLNAKKTIHEKFSMEKMTESFISIYRKYVNNN